MRSRPREGVYGIETGREEGRVLAKDDSRCREERSSDPGVLSAARGYREPVLLVATKAATAKAESHKSIWAGGPYLWTQENSDGGPGVRSAAEHTWGFLGARTRRRPNRVVREYPDADREAAPPSPEISIAKSVRAPRTGSETAFGTTPQATGEDCGVEIAPRWTADSRNRNTGKAISASPSESGRDRKTAPG